MIRISNIKYSVKKSEADLPEYIKEKYKINNIKEFRIHKQSIDARKKNDIHYVYTVDISADNERIIADKFQQVKTIKNCIYQLPIGDISDAPIVIAGFGPCGMMCAHSLAIQGYNVIVLERGNDIDNRIKDVEEMKKNGVLNSESNVQFGEGGAGTFSDGKLTTGVNDIRIQYVLEEFAKHGAPEEIVYKSKPHIGTDKLVNMVKSFREDIISHGGKILFNSFLSDIVIENDLLKKVIVNSNDSKFEIETSILVLATGHSARDTFEMIKKHGAHIERKVFAIGTRIEHKQKIIDKSQYGDMSEFLPAADYKLSTKTSNGRTAYTFCMCPGGKVIASASEEGGIVVNGMSEFNRDGENANSALLVNVLPSDLEGDDPLEGCYFQRRIEKKAYEMGNGYYAPCQTIGDFLYDNGSQPNVDATYKPGVKMCKLDKLFPEYVITTLREAIPVFDKKIKGFADEGAILTAPETRSSSPIRILRDTNTRQSNIKGMYPSGEGAGYAGGIMTAAIDGIKTAEAIITNEFNNKI